jgi:nucleoside-diphosphate kinase
MTEMTEQTLLVLKPDAVVRRWVGAEVIKTLLDHGIRIRGFREGRFTRELAERFYEVHRGRFFYPSLIEYITSAPVVAMILEGEGVVKKVREILGATKPEEAEENTLRGRYGVYGGVNVAHASDSPENSRRERALMMEHFGLTPEPGAEERARSYAMRYARQDGVDNTLELRRLSMRLAEKPELEEETRRRFRSLLREENSDLDEEELERFIDVMIGNCLVRG